MRAVLRTVHIQGGGVLLGACLFDQTPDVVRRGLSVIIKILLLLLLGLLPGWEVPLLVVILALGAVSSHPSRRVRHRRWWRIEGVRSDVRRG
ncbi:MAG: hypothetical protein DWQ08_14475 [Proteobacteria bacterium]|nr:MAG: hypothetical protein DWQ08_14475 [Pseudomonadota bacterium]